MSNQVYDEDFQTTNYASLGHSDFALVYTRFCSQGPCVSGQEKLKDSEEDRKASLP